MAQPPEPEPEPENDESYNSASDEDFNPDQQALPEDQDSSEDEAKAGAEAEAATATITKRRRKRRAPATNVDADVEGDGDGDGDFNNSGDEATIRKGRSKKRRRGDEAASSDEDDGGEGGLVKTRAQRKAEHTVKAPLANLADSTVDVDALWAQMSAKPASSTSIKPTSDSTGSAGYKQDNGLIGASAASAVPPDQPMSKQPALDDTSSTITIKRRYDFAGETLEEERTVAADSAEARLYIEEQARLKEEVSKRTADKPPTRRPVKRKPLFGASTATSSEATGKSKATKLNTLEKSKLDWAAHVDEEGISEELDQHRRAKDTYLGRVDFLGRMDAKREGTKPG